MQIAYSDHVMFSRELAFSLSASQARICGFKARDLKETVLRGNIMLSAMGKQNIQAKKVHCFTKPNPLGAKFPNQINS